jgi:hypothetical protein
MARRIQISLLQRNVHAVAELLDGDAPKTCEAVWKALPLEGPAFHAKRAHNEVYMLVSAFAPPSMGPEHATIFPIPRDVVYFFFPPERVGNYIRGYDKYLPKECGGRQRSGPGRQSGNTAEQKRPINPHSCSSCGSTTGCPS